MYTFSLSVLVQALIIISMSGAADHGSYRKTFLLHFAYVGATSTMIYLLATPNLFVLGSLLAIIANTCFGASFVLLNSFLPVLVRNHPSLQKTEALEVHAQYEEERRLMHERTDCSPERSMDASAALLEGPSLDGADEPADRPDGSVSGVESVSDIELLTKISSNGVGVGYIAAMTAQIFSIVIVHFTGGSLWSLRIVLFFLGAWWFIFTFPAAWYLRTRPGPPLHIAGGLSARDVWRAYLIHSWRSLGKTIKQARRLRDTLLFLAAWFLLSDGRLPATQYSSPSQMLHARANITG